MYFFTLDITAHDTVHCNVLVQQHIEAECFQTNVPVKKQIRPTIPTVNIKYYRYMRCRANNSVNTMLSTTL